MIPFRRLLGRVVRAGWFSMTRTRCWALVFGMALSLSGAAKAAEYSIRVRLQDVKAVDNLEEKNGGASLLLTSVGAVEITQWSPSPPAGITVPTSANVLRIMYGTVLDQAARTRSLQDCARKALLVQARPETYDLTIIFAGVDDTAVSLSSGWLVVYEFNYYQCGVTRTTTSSAAATAASSSGDVTEDVGAAPWPPGAEGGSTPEPDL